MTDMLGQIWYSPYSGSINLLYLPEMLFIIAVFLFFFSLRIMLTKLILHQKAEKVQKWKREKKTEINIPS